MPDFRQSPRDGSPATRSSASLGKEGPGRPPRLVERPVQGPGTGFDKCAGTRCVRDALVQPVRESFASVRTPKTTLAESHLSDETHALSIHDRRVALPSPGARAAKRLPLQWLM